MRRAAICAGAVVLLATFPWPAVLSPSEVPPHLNAPCCCLRYGGAIYHEKDGFADIIFQNDQRVSLHVRCSEAVGGRRANYHNQPETHRMGPSIDYTAVLNTLRLALAPQVALNDEALHQYPPAALPDVPVKKVVRCFHRHIILLISLPAHPRRAAAPPRDLHVSPRTSAPLLNLAPTASPRLASPLPPAQGTEEVFSELVLPVVAHPGGGKDRYSLTLRPGDYVTVLNEVPRQDELWRKLYARASSIGSGGAGGAGLAGLAGAASEVLGAAGDHHQQQQQQPRSESNEPRSDGGAAAGPPGEKDSAAAAADLEEQEAKHNRYFSKKRQESLWTDGVLLKIFRKGFEEPQVVIAPLVPTKTIRKKQNRYDKEDSDSAPGPARAAPRARSHPLLARPVEFTRPGLSASWGAFKK